MKTYLKSLLFAGLSAGTILSVTASAADEKPAAPPAGEHAPAGPGGERRGGPGGGRMNPEQQLKMMTEHLGLTKEQQDKILPILQATAEKRRALPEDQRRTEGKKLMDAQHDQIVALLTPEQKEKMEKMPQRGPGGGNRRDGGAGGPPPAEHKE